MRHTTHSESLVWKGVTVAAVTVASLALISTSLPQVTKSSSTTPAPTGYFVSLGDSFISGEGGRWRGNIAMRDSATSNLLGTDRAATGCNVLGSACKIKDPEKIYGKSYLNPITGNMDGCHRSDSAEIVSAGLGPAANFSCSGH